ncbi:hypothetical protein Tcan_11060 [Toxocara canis]|uniref:Uncharacterized protein n=1 Tax=Toxocara canis TaxID=6265 RepID=A0A0B2UVZ2_TOXCA|nr:hypothetical protein Tcan_11060 [Toxocara canis]
MRLFLLLNSFLALLSHAATENEKLAQDLLSSKDKLLAEARQLEDLAILLLKQNEEQAQVKALKESLVGLPIGAYLTVPRANRHTSSQSSQGETISDTERLRMSEILKRFSLLRKEESV